MERFEYEFLSATKIIPNGFDADEWMIDWANKKGAEGWEFVNFTIDRQPVYGEQEDMDSYAPVVGVVAIAKGFAKRRLSGPPYR